MGCGGGSPLESGTGPPRHRRRLLALNSSLRAGHDGAPPRGALSAPQARSSAGPKKPSGILARSPRGRPRRARWAPGRPATPDAASRPGFASDR